MHEKEQDLRIVEEEIMETLFDLQLSMKKNNRIRMGDILNRMGGEIAKTQLTNIVRRKLEPLGYVDYLPYEGIILTTEGYSIAKRIARNHRLAEAMLYQIFEIPLNILHEQACSIEHGITDEMADYIFKKLDEKKTPFGAPIPMGEVDDEIGCIDPYLPEIEKGTSVILTRIQNHSFEVTDTLLSLGIDRIGTKFKVVDTTDEAIFIEIENKKYSIPNKISRILCVKIQK